MRTTPLTILGFLLLTLPAAADDYQIIGTATSRIENLVRTETTVQVGDNPLNQFKMTRLVKDVPAERLRGAILFFPPAGFSFTFYEQRDEGGGFGTSPAEFFARRNYDVYGYSPPWDGIPAGLCEAGVLDCSVMATWDLQSVVDAAAFIRSRIELLRPGTEIVVGGFSLGAIATIAVVNADPDDYDGALLWDGFLFTLDPDAIAMNEAYCAGFEAALAAGFFYDGVSMPIFKQVGQAAELNPSGLTPNPLYPPVLTNHQVLVVALSVPTPGLWVSQPVPPYVLARGSFEEDRLLFASEPRALETTRRLYSYLPNAIARDTTCSVAGLDDQHVANLGSFTGPVLAIGAGHGWGALFEDQLALFGSGNVTLQRKEDFGHMDHFLYQHHRNLVERPILYWLQEVFQ